MAKIYGAKNILIKGFLSKQIKFISDNNNNN